MTPHCRDVIFKEQTFQKRKMLTFDQRNALNELFISWKLKSKPLESQRDVIQEKVLENSRREMRVRRRDLINLISDIKTQTLALIL